MAADDDRHEEQDATKNVFDQPATIREPAAPRVPQTQQGAGVPVIPLPGEEQARAAEARPRTLQEARDATDALLHEILEEDDLGAPAEPQRPKPPAQPSREEDWPSELHSLHLPEQQ